MGRRQEIWQIKKKDGRTQETFLNTDEDGRMDQLIHGRILRREQREEDEWRKRTCACEQSSLQCCGGDHLWGSGTAHFWIEI